MQRRNQLWESVNEWIEIYRSELESVEVALTQMHQHSYGYIWAVDFCKDEN
jgi:hypothetical protein